MAEKPDHGELLVGSGGVRKFRFARAGQGKSGGFRVISFYHSSSMPVFLLAVFAKNDKANLTRAERNALAVLTGRLVDTYMRRRKS